MKTNQIKNQIENQLQNQLLATFSMLDSALPAISQIAQTLTDLLPQPEELSFYPSHNWIIDSFHGAEITSLILDTSFQKSNWDFETPIIEKLNFELKSDLGSIRITSSEIANGLILLNISFLE